MWLIKFNDNTIASYETLDSARKHAMIVGGFYGEDAEVCVVRENG